MLHVPDLPEADAVQILRYFLSQAAISAKTAKDLPVALASEGPQKGSRPPLAKRARGEGANTRASVKEPVAIASASDPTSGGQGIAAVKSLKKNGDMNTVGKKKSLRSSSVGEDSDMVVIAAKGLSPHIGTNGNSAVLSNGHIGVVQPHDDEGTSIDSGGVSDGDPMEAEMGVGGVGGGTQGSKKTKKRARDDAKSAVTPAARAERGVRVALTLPHNEAFLRSALSGLSHGEVIVVLKASLTRWYGVCFGRAVGAAGGDNIICVAMVHGGFCRVQCTGKRLLGSRFTLISAVRVWPCLWCS